ncbi:hypothetical protein [Nostoc sp.]|uniref:hypothetical protein n=1 Tax=Nostoc sp. TaxID=1180 RepID=UPI002FFCDC43
MPATTSREQDAPTTFRNYGSQNRCGLRVIILLFASPLPTPHSLLPTSFNSDSGNFS